MMIGLGIDIVKKERIAKAIERFGDRFCQQICSKKELKDMKSLSPNIIDFISKRFCAKESVAKAIGCGFGELLSFKDIEISNDRFGKPFIVKSNKLINAIQQTETLNDLHNSKKSPDKKKDEIVFHLSITDEKSLVSSVTAISWIK